MNTLRRLVGTGLALTTAVGLLFAGAAPAMADTGTTGTSPAAGTSLVPATEPAAPEDDGTDVDETKDQALAEFASTFGPVPGAPGAPDPAGDTDSGTGALNGVLAHWPELSPEQQTAIEDAAAIDVPADETAPAHTFPRDCKDDPTNQARIVFRMAEVQQKLGTSYTPRVFACTSPKNPKAGAETYAYHRKGVQTCEFRFYDYYTKAGADEQDEFLAHEAFHCVANAVLESDQAFYTLPGWIQEGLADWACAALTGHFADQDQWASYLDNPGTSLVKRKYDALGFWWELDYQGVDVWAQIVPLLKLQTTSGPNRSKAAFDLVASPNLLDAWPASYIRDASRAREWDTQGVGIPPAGGLQFPFGGSVENGAPAVTVKAPAFAVERTAVDLTADVVQLASTGSVHGRFGPGYTPTKFDFPISAAASSIFCTLGADRCKCPDDSPKAGTSFQVIEPGGSTMALVALTGGSSKGSVAISGTSLDEFCGRAPEKPKRRGHIPDRCPSSELVGRPFLESPRWGALGGNTLCIYDNGGRVVGLGPKPDKLPPDYRPVEVPGADAAWVTTNCTPAPCLQVLVVIGDRHASISGYLSQDEAIARMSRIIGAG
jgi:hypothetical protein